MLAWAFCEVGQNEDQSFIDEVPAFDAAWCVVYRRIETQGWLKASLQVGGVIRNQLTSECKKDCFWSSLIIAVLKDKHSFSLFDVVLRVNRFFEVLGISLKNYNPTLCVAKSVQHHAYPTPYITWTAGKWELINHTSQAWRRSLEGLITL